MRPSVLVIVGPTASGKTDLSMRIAEKFNGEIICADSLTIFKNMDIGTAKPTNSEQKKIRHWGLDLVGPGQRFTAADFKAYAKAKISEIQRRGKLPIVVGGTGLYIDSLIFNFSFVPQNRISDRRIYSRMSVNQLQNIIKQKGYRLPENLNNKRHLINTIGRRGCEGTKNSQLPKGFIVVGLLPPDDILKQKIGLRVDKMFEAGLVDETKQLLKQYGRGSLLAKAKVAYGPVVEFLSGQSSLARSKQGLATAHWQFARRQRTWFRRNPYINWFKDAESAFEHIYEEVRPCIKIGKTL